MRMQVGFAGTTVLVEQLFEHVNKEGEILWPALGNEEGVVDMPRLFKRTLVLFPLEATAASSSSSLI
jgi:hypothetical protein